MEAVTDPTAQDPQRGQLTVWAHFMLEHARRHMDSKKSGDRHTKIRKEQKNKQGHASKTLEERIMHLVGAVRGAKASERGSPPRISPGPIILWRRVGHK